MDPVYPKGLQVGEEATLQTELAKVRTTIYEIGNRLFEPIPIDENKLNANPRSGFKLSNMREEIRQINSDLLEILQAVSLL